MKQVVVLVALMTLSPLVCSQAPFPLQPLVLDKIVFQTSAKQWVSTQTALLSVNINVTLNNANLVKAREDIMGSLAKIAQGDWHLLEFDRSQDSSGLEKLSVQAQVRVNQNLLTDIYKNAKSVSQPGAQYTVNTVEFKPSLEEIQTVRSAVRKQLYQQVNDELAQMNKAYPTQNYSVSNLVFIEGDNPQPPVAYQAKTMNLMMAGSSVPIAVSNELVLTAMVEAASNRKPGS
jgi:hypothetical protein